MASLGNFLVNAGKNLGGSLVKGAGNILLASLMNENDLKLFSSFKNNSKNLMFNKEEFKLVKQYADKILNPALKFASFEPNDITLEMNDLEIAIKLHFTSDGHRNTLLQKYHYTNPASNIFLFLKKVNTTGKMSTDTKVPPIVRLFQNEFKLALGIAVANSDKYTKSAKQLVQESALLSGKNKYKLGFTASDVLSPKLKINTMLASLRVDPINKNDFINDNTIKTDLNEFKSKLKDLVISVDSNIYPLAQFFIDADNNDYLNIEPISKIKSNILNYLVKMITGSTNINFCNLTISRQQEKFSCMRFIFKSDKPSTNKNSVEIVVNFKTLIIEKWEIKDVNMMMFPKSGSNFNFRNTLFKRIQEKIKKTPFIYPESDAEKSFIQGFYYMILSFKTSNPNVFNVINNLIVTQNSL